MHHVSLSLIILITQHFITHEVKFGTTMICVKATLLSFASKQINRFAGFRNISYQQLSTKMFDFFSSQVQNLSNADHAHYFNMDLYRWSADGCPKNKEDYRPIAESAVKNGKTFSYDLLIVILGAVIIFL